MSEGRSAKVIADSLGICFNRQFHKAEIMKRLGSTHRRTR